MGTMEGCGSLAISEFLQTPIPEIGQSSDSYKDGYGTGFKAGLGNERLPIK